MLLSYPMMDKIQYNRRQKQLIETFESIGLDNSAGDIGVSDELKNEILENVYESENNRDSYTSNEHLIAEKHQDLEDVVGIIRISSIDLNMIIYNGASEEKLSKGIGMIETEKKIGINNVGLAGHRSTTYGKQFNRLDEVSLSDIIVVHTMNNTYEFEVIKSFVVHKSEINVLDDQKEPLLTLVTCTPLGKKNPSERLIIQAKLTK